MYFVLLFVLSEDGASGFHFLYVPLNPFRSVIKFYWQVFHGW